MGDKISKIFIYFILILFSTAPPAYSISTGRYDNILLKMEKQKVQNNTSEIKPRSWALTFKHDTLPNLDGIWLVSKTTTKRKINPVLTKPISFVHCNSILPFEKRDFLNKEVVINSRGSDFFVISARYAITTDSFFDPNQNTVIEYDNFGLKGVIDPEDLTYAYTLKLKDFLGHRTLARQLWLKGKLKYDSISNDRITAKGYEIEYTPECQGWVMDEIEFVLVKTKEFKDAYGGAIARKLPIFEQPAYADEVPQLPKALSDSAKDKPGIFEQPAYAGEVPHLPKVLLDSAKDKSGIEASSKYKPFDSSKSKGKTPSVPGMW